MGKRIKKIIVILIVVFSIGSIYSYIEGNPIEKVVIFFNAKAILKEEYGINPSIISFGYDTMRKMGDSKYFLRLKLPGKERFDEFVMSIKDPFDKSTYTNNYINLVASEALSLELEERYKSSLLEGRNVILNAELPDDIIEIIDIKKLIEIKEDIRLSANIHMNELYDEATVDYQELFEIFQMLKLEYVKLDDVIIWFNTIKYGGGYVDIYIQKKDFENIINPKDLENFLSK